MWQMLEVLKQIELQSGASVTIDQSTKDHFLLVVAQLWQDLASEIMNSDSGAWVQQVADHRRLRTAFRCPVRKAKAGADSLLYIQSKHVKTYRSKSFFDHFAVVVMCHWMRVGFKEKQSNWQVGEVTFVFCSHAKGVAARRLIEEKLVEAGRQDLRK